MMSESEGASGHGKADIVREVTRISLYKSDPNVDKGERGGEKIRKFCRHHIRKLQDLLQRVTNTGANFDANLRHARFVTLRPRSKGSNPPFMQNSDGNLKGDFVRCATGESARAMPGDVAWWHSDS